MVIRKTGLRSLVSPGTRFGDLVVISDSPEEGVHLKCDCGQNYRTRNRWGLRKGKVIRCCRCAQSSRIRWRVGDKFDKLTIIGFNPQEPRRATCRCECGNIVEVRSDVLSNNKTNNCGCAPRGLWRGGMIPSGLYHNILSNAKTRGLRVDVTLDQLWTLFQKQGEKCALTGIHLTLDPRTGKPSTASVDRIDSAKAYTLDNIQWVHKDINMMKRNIPQERFLELCQMVTDFRSTASNKE